MGQSPSSSPPRRWAATAATGGRPDGERDRRRAGRRRAGRRWWHIADPADPATAPDRGRAIRPPAPPTPTSRCTVLARRPPTRGRRGTARLPVPRRRVVWAEPAPLARHGAVPRPAPRRGAARSTRRPATTDGAVRDDDEAWVELVPGARRPGCRRPRWSCVATATARRRLLVDGEPVTPPDLQVRGVVDVEPRPRRVPANPIDDADRVRTSGASDPAPDARAAHRRRRACTLRRWPAATSSSCGRDARCAGPRDGRAAGRPGRGRDRVARRAARSSTPGARSSRSAIASSPPPCCSRRHDALDQPLPVLLDPYGGPHAQRVMQSRGGAS